MHILGWAVVVIWVVIIGVAAYFAIINTPNCKRGGKRHSWYCRYGLFMVQKTGEKRLPGDRTYSDWQRPSEEVGYRHERHCMDCDRREYSKYGNWDEKAGTIIYDWVAVPGYEGTPHVENN